MFANWDDNLIVSKEESWNDLIQSLCRKRGFGLFFVTSTNVKEVKTRLTKLEKTAVLRANTTNLYDRIAEVSSCQPKTLLVDGFDELFEQYGKECSDTSGVPPILNHLNQQRERIKDHFQFNIVFLLSEKSLNYFILRAPDFFDWRSGTYKV